MFSKPKNSVRMLCFVRKFLKINRVCLARDGRKNCYQKRGMSSSSPVFARQSPPLCHVRFVKNERLECEIKVSLGYYSAFYRHQT